MSTFLPGSDWIALISSLTIRILSFVFLRWIPGHPFPPLILAFAVLYATSFVSIISKSSTDTAENKQSEIVQKGNHIVGENEQSSIEERETTLSKQPNGGSAIKIKIRKIKYGSPGVEANNSQYLKVILSGMPRSGAMMWNYVTAGINALLVLMVVDLTFRAPIFYPSEDLSFARVGYVDDKSVNIMLREPNFHQFPLFLSYRSEVEQAWHQLEGLYAISEELDYTHTIHIDKLRHSTRYEYSISNGRSGYFRTAPPIGQVYKDTSRFSFLTSSCIKPRFPYNPLQHPLYIPGLEYVSFIAARVRASFMLFLGDFIYIDVPFRIGSESPTYRAEYRRVYRSPSWESAGKELPWLHVIDDHEIANDWDRGLDHPYPAAIDPFAIYHHSVNPPPVFQNTTYYSFKQGPASFFLIDSRRYRSPEFELPADHASKTMLGQQQLSSVLDWLRSPEPPGVHWKIFVSSIPFTRNWRVNALDTWSGYLSERQIILEAMWDAASSSRKYGVIILSGDRHEFAATRFPAPEETEEMRLARTFGTGDSRWAPGTAVYEFSCSPLSMFYLPVRSYWENKGEGSGVGAGGEDQNLAYIPDGNSKMGAVEIENTIGSEQSALRYRLFVDGEESWSYIVTSGKEGGADRKAIWD